jgi:ankyrin repeat protein
MPTDITKNKFITNILSNNYEKVRRTISRCPSIVHECITDGRNPLHKAIYQKYTDIVKLLLDSGANVNQCESKGMQTLFEFNNNINVVFDGATPLLAAISKGDLNCSIVQILLEYGANVNQCDYHNTSPLYLAIKGRNTKIANLLLEYGADTNICNYTNTSPLQVAVVNGNSQIVEVLLEHGATIDAYAANAYAANVDAANVDAANTSPLYLAAVRWANPLFIAKKKEYENIIKMLLNSGADVNKCSICLENLN